MTEKDIPTPEQQQAETAHEAAETNENTPQNTEKNSSTDEMNEKLAQLQALADESKSKYIYLLSDFENYKRHAARERIELMQTAGRDVLSSLIPILDDFDRAEKNGALSEGMHLIHNKLVSTLKSKGLAIMETKIGDDFNADHQEAVVEVPAPSADLVGKVVDILEPGYFLADKIIRFAKVVVGK